MALLVSHVLEQMRLELGGGDIPAELGALSILNQAGEHFYSMHPWKWAVGRSALLDLRGTLSGTDATWIASTKTLTDVGMFTDYTLVAGDEIQINAGAGVTVGTYKTASRSSANEIILETSISSVDLSTGDIEWRIDPTTIDLPDDLRDIISIDKTSQTSLGGVVLTTIAEVQRLRASTVTVRIGTGLFWGAVVYAGAPPRPILEIHPVSGNNKIGAMRCAYRSRWATVGTDSTRIQIPDFTQALFIRVARAFAGGYIRESVATLSERLRDVMSGPEFAAVVRSDGMVQPYGGTLRGGGGYMWRRPRVRSFYELSTNVEPPSI